MTATRRSGRRPGRGGQPCARWRAAAFVGVLLATLLVPTPTRAADPVLGALRWSRSLPGGAHALALAGRTVVVTTDAGRVVAFDLRGRPRWEQVADVEESGRPAADRDVVLVPTHGGVVALSTRDGSILWERRDGPAVTGVALASGRALVGDHSGTVRVVDAQHGDLHWEVTYPGEVWSAPAVDAGSSVVVVVWSESESPAVRAFDLVSGALRWEHPVGLFTAAPVVAGGRVFVATGNGRYQAWVADFDAATGESAWALIVPASFGQGIVPAYDTRSLVVVDQLGRMSSIEPRSGTPQWTQALERRMLVTEVVLLHRRVIVCSLSREVFVLDRRSGRVVVHTDAAALDGMPVAMAALPDGERVVLAYRLTLPGRLELRRVR